MLGDSERHAGVHRCDVDHPTLGRGGLRGALQIVIEDVRDHRLGALPLHGRQGLVTIATRRDEVGSDEEVLARVRQRVLPPVLVGDLDIGQLLLGRVEHDANVDALEKRSGAPLFLDVLVVAVEPPLEAFVDDPPVTDTDAELVGEGEGNRDIQRGDRAPRVRSALKFGIDGRAH